MRSLVIVASDIEVGAGGPEDDFPQSGWMATWLERRPTADKVDLVLAGDTFDFLKTSVDGHWPRHIDSEVALAKWRRIEAAHPAFLDGIASWLQRGEGRHQVHFVVGNHDLEIQFPSVQAALETRLGGMGVRFPGNTWYDSGLLVHHGHLDDPMFKVDGAPFLPFEGRDILNLPWGAVALLDVTMPMIPEIAGLDRLRPRKRVFELLPEARKLALDTFWRYWTRDFWADFVRGDPLKRVTASMLREVVYRMGTGDPSVRPGVTAHALEENPRVVCSGHWHQPSWHTEDEVRFLRLGAFRNEFELHPDGRVGRQLGKTHAEVWLNDGEVESSALIESVAPPPLAGHVPAHIDAFRPSILAQLEALAAAS